jgi:hypothetical protein
VVVDPKHRAWEALAVAKAESGDAAGAMAAAEEGRRAWKEVGLPSQDSNTLLRIATVQAERLGRIELALSTTGSIADQGVRCRALMRVAVAQARGGDVTAARSTFQRAGDLMARSPLDDRASLMAALTAALVDAGDLAGAHTTAILIKTLPGPGGMLSIDELSFSEAATAVVKRYAKLRQWDTAISLLGSMGPISSIHTDFILNELAVSSAEAGVHDLSRKALSEMVSPIHGRATALATLAKSRALTGERSRAEADFRDAVRDAKTVPLALIRTRILARIAEIRGEAGDREAARRLLEETMTEIEGASDPLSVRDRATCLAYLAGAFSGLGDFARARGVIRKAVEAELNSGPGDPDDRDVTNMDAMRAISAALVRSGDLHGGVTWAEGLTTPLRRCFAYIGLAEAILESKRAPEVLLSGTASLAPVLPAVVLNGGDQQPTTGLQPGQTRPPVPRVGNPPEQQVEVAPPAAGQAALLLIDLSIRPRSALGQVTIAGRVENGGAVPLDVAWARVQVRSGPAVTRSHRARVTPARLAPGAGGTFTLRFPIGSAKERYAVEFINPAGEVIRHTEPPRGRPSP